MPRLPETLSRAVVGVLAVTAGVLAHPDGALGAGPAGERRLTVFYSAEVHGVLEPCGCTSDPLGDVARYAELVRRASKQGPVALLDGGGLSRRSRAAALT